MLQLTTIILRSIMVEDYYFPNETSSEGALCRYSVNDFVYARSLISRSFQKRNWKHLTQVLKLSMEKLQRDESESLFGLQLRDSGAREQ